MSVLRGLELSLTVDDVLRCQGADPVAIRARRPHLADAAERALEEALRLLAPQVAYRQFDVASLRHEQLALADGGLLSGPLIARHLGTASRIVVMLCTIGQTLEEYASRAMLDEPVHGLALDGAASAAVESLANAACTHFEAQAHQANLKTSIPLSPGMIGWPVAEGQPEIFALVDGSEIGVRLTESEMMIPRKSISMVLGIGAELDNTGRTCEYCALHETCRYQDHYDPAAT